MAVDGGGTVGVKALRAVMTIADAAKLNADALAARHGFSRATLANPEFRASHDAWTALWDDLVESTDDPALGLHAAMQLPVGHWDVVDYLIACSATLGEGFGKLERYFWLISTAVQHSLLVEGDEAQLRCAYRAGASRSRAGAELAVASIVLRFRELASRPWLPSFVCFAHDPAAPITEYERVLGCSVRFGADQDRIVMARSVLDIPMKRPEAELCAVLERHAQALLAQVAKPSATLVERVKDALALELMSGTPSLGHIAKRLGMSTRTLQRRLDEARVAYRELVDQTRAHLAQRYLDDPEIALGEIAYLVGFANVSAFYKAFRRWNGETPGEYRARKA